MKTVRDIIQDNKSIFEHCLTLSKELSDYNKKTTLLKLASSYATFRHTGYFSSNEIESQLLEISNKINFNITDDAFMKKSFLHVMTQCYNVGGHTRVVERWINNSLSGEEHSIILISQGRNEIPCWLRKASEKKKGKMILLKEKDDIEKAIKLNQIASTYEYIVLHIHPDDIVPILAFGNNRFRRPIIFFNHADHIFWLGVSIADIVAEIRTSGQNLSLERRGVKKVKLLGIPIECREKKDKIECRKKNNLSLDAKIILSIGSPFKYRPFEKYNFIEFALQLVGKYKDAIFIVIGPDKKEKIWKDAYQVSQGKLNAVGIITDSDVIDTYRCSADLYIESFPFGSSTALLDTVILGVPVLSLTTEMDSLDVFIKNGVQCRNTTEMISRAVDILDGNIIQNLKEDIIENYTDNGWRYKLESLILSTPKYHSLNRNFKSYCFIDEYDKYLYLTMSSQGKRICIDINQYAINHFNEKIFFLKNAYAMNMVSLNLMKNICRCAI